MITVEYAVPGASALAGEHSTVPVDASRATPPRTEVPSVSTLAKVAVVIVDASIDSPNAAAVAAMPIA
jgi:hypothetical protein